MPNKANSVQTKAITITTINPSAMKVKHIRRGAHIGKSKTVSHPHVKWPKAFNTRRTNHANPITPIESSESMIISFVN